MTEATALRTTLEEALQGELLEVFDHKEGVRAAREWRAPRFGGR
jgi:hypothetical protein